jgi:hypothetical protein
MIAGAFLPLFPKSLLPIIIKKFETLLLKNGYGLVYFKLSNDEGLVLKKDYNKAIFRYRTSLSKKEALSVIQKRFKIINHWKGYGNKGWTVILFQKI